MTDYTRKGAVITEVETGKSVTYFIPNIAEQIPSINAAKRMSKELQKNGSTVRVEK